MKNLKIKTSFVSHMGGYQFYDFYFNIRGKFSEIRCYNTGFFSMAQNRFRSHTGKVF